MKQFQNFIFIMSAGFILISCSHSEPMMDSNEKPHIVDLTADGEAAPYATNTQESYSSMVRTSSKGRVQIYPLDSPVEILRTEKPSASFAHQDSVHEQDFITSSKEPAVEPAPVRPVSFGAHPALDGEVLPDRWKRRYADDPRVEIFPFE